MVFTLHFGLFEVLPCLRFILTHQVTQFQPVSGQPLLHPSGSFCCLLSPVPAVNTLTSVSVELRTRARSNPNTNVRHSTPRRVTTPLLSYRCTATRVGCCSHRQQTIGIERTFSFPWINTLAGANSLETDSSGFVWPEHFTHPRGLVLCVDCSLLELSGVGIPSGNLNPPYIVGRALVSLVPESRIKQVLDTRGSLPLYPLSHILGASS